MLVKFEDRTIDIELIDSPLKDKLEKSLKHLQHLDIPLDHRPRLSNSDLQSKINHLVRCASVLDIPINLTSCKSGDQKYFNYLHGIFEKNYDGRREWLDYHDAIHLCESNWEVPNPSVDYLDLAGPLTSQINREWMSHGVTKLKAGDVYCTWAELGKTPYRYWRDGEPNTLDRICELAKPWIHLRPNLHIALRDIDLVQGKDIIGFSKWWQQYQEHWCRHWNLRDWQLLEQFAVIVVGKVCDLSAIEQNCQSNSQPQRISLGYAQQTEHLHFSLEIDACYKTHPPCVEVKIDDICVHQAELMRGLNRINIDQELDTGKHKLYIHRTGATDQDPTQMIKIQQLCIDDLDMTQMILKRSYYRPCYPEAWIRQQRQNAVELPETVPYETVLGHNGVWCLEFFSPFYPDYLEVSRAAFQ